MSILDTTIVNVALHTLGHDLHSSLAQIQWVITGYLLSLAAVIPVTGWAARRFGAKRCTDLAGAVHGRLGAVRGRHLDDRARAVPRAAGRGRRHDHADRAADHGPGRRPQADGSRDGHRRDARDARSDPRAGRRRHDPREPALVVDLPRQRADRLHRVRPRLAHRFRRPNRARPGAWTCSAWRCCRRRRRRSSTASPSSARQHQPHRADRRAGRSSPGSR